MNRRRKRRVPFAAYAALIFNGALCVTPIMGAHLISSAYGEKQSAFQTTPEALAATRAAMDERFRRLTENSQTGDEATPREVWSEMVRKTLEAKNPQLPQVRGLLLGAPAMLGGKDGDALLARANVSSEPNDDALLQAALAYLPGDLQDKYETEFQPKSAIFMNSAASSALPGGADAVPAPTTKVAAYIDEPKIATDLVGDMKDLVKPATQWANNRHADVERILLKGIGLTMADDDAREGASVAIAALGHSAAPIPFKTYMSHKLGEVLPVEELKRRVYAEIGDETQFQLDAEVPLERIFRTTIDAERVKPLLDEFKILQGIAHDTSPEAAVAIVSRVRDPADLRAAALVAAAGGDRAAALELFDGDNLLETARTVVPMTNALKLQIAGVAACILLLAFVAMTTFWKSFRRNKPIKKSAVYLMEEHPA